MPDQDTKPKTRNIVLCFDGTGDWVETDETNVTQMFQDLEPENQVCYYDAGVGTLSDSKSLTDKSRLAMKLVDLGAATGLGDKVAQAYAYLVRHYKKDDEIYLLGFSRGAYTARIVAGMVHNFGLLRPELEHLAPYLYQSVANFGDDKVKIDRFEADAARLRNDFCRTDKVEIAFMGLFDTVSSVGIIDRFRVFPNTSYNPSVRRTCHAVSIEESRNAFPETLMRPDQPNLTEVWFPGVHRDCGGGIGEPEPPRKAVDLTAWKSDAAQAQRGEDLKAMRRIANEALAWMELEAERADLRIKRRSLDLTAAPEPNYPSYDPYVFLGFYPQNIFVKRVMAFRVFWPNFRHVRVVPENALVHEVALEAFPGRHGDAFPPNLPRVCRRFRTGDVALTLAKYEIPEFVWNVEDLVGTILGTILIAQWWNRAVGSPFGESFPGLLGLFETVLFILFLAGQAVGKGLFKKGRGVLRPWLDVALPAFGAVAAVALFWTFPSIPVLAGLAVGAVAHGVSQLGSLPIVRADRTLPYLMRAAASVAGLYWVVRMVNGVLPTLLRAKLLDLYDVLERGLHAGLPDATLGQAALVAALLAALASALLRLFRERPLMEAMSKRPGGTDEVPRRKSGVDPIFNPL